MSIQFRLDLVWRIAAIAMAFAATVTFPFALLLPFFLFEPSFGDPLVDGIVEYADPGSLDAKRYSVLTGIGATFADGDIVVAVVLLLFSVCFPAVKLALLWAVIVHPAPSSSRLIRRLETLGPWSMADVFVVSVMLLAFKSFPGGTSFSVAAGYYLFLTSVLAGLASAWIVRQRLPRSGESLDRGAQT